MIVNILWPINIVFINSDLIGQHACTSHFMLALSNFPVKFIIIMVISLIPYYFLPAVSVQILQQKLACTPVQPSESKSVGLKANI